MQPINPQFNNACHYIGSRIFPLGFDVYNGAPNTHADLSDSMSRLNRMAIWSGDYGADSAFAENEAWYQYRAWHDWTHYRYVCPFTLEGEHVACHIQAGQLARLYGRGEDVARMIALLFQVTLGPLEAAEAGEVVTSQYALSLRDWESWLPYARRLLAEQGSTDADAKAYASRCYSLRLEVGPPIPRRHALGGALPVDPSGELDQKSLFA